VSIAGLEAEVSPDGDRPMFTVVTGCGR
jgi:hypothetical protein